MLSSFFSRKRKQTAAGAAERKSYLSGGAFVYDIAQAVRGGRGYSALARDGYMRNVIAYRSVRTVAQAAGSLHIQCKTRGNDGTLQEAAAHPLARLLAAPAPGKNASFFLQEIVSSLMIGGNAYIYAPGAAGGRDAAPPRELHLLRQDCMRAEAGKGGLASTYLYDNGAGDTRRFAVNRVTGASDILHIRHYHPLDEMNGFAPAEAASDAVEQHNRASRWNLSLLENGARPSGALIVKQGEHGEGFLTDEQYQRLREQTDTHYAGAANAGRPLILEGGLDWREMSISPRDMEFLDAKHSAARDIALAFGVPPQLLGIPGDNTYANLAEARLALWEQTVMPLAEEILSVFNRSLAPLYGDSPVLSYDYERVTALSPRRDALWKRVGDAAFLNEDEKRALLGL